MLTNKMIVLTGANSGIGLETLKLFVQGEGNKILAVDLHTDKLAEFDSEKVIPLEISVSSKENVDIIFSTAIEKLGKIDIFFANAGFPYYEQIDYVNWEKTSKIFETNVFSPIYSYEKFQEYLNGAEGSFVITISAMGKMGMPGYSLYGASKFAMQGFQESIRLEKPKNIKLICLYPVATDTGFFKAANKFDFTKPFPLQKPQHVAKKAVASIEKGKKYAMPCMLFSFSQFLFKFLPFMKLFYWSVEKAKFKNFIANLKQQKKDKEAGK